MMRWIRHRLRAFPGIPHRGPVDAVDSTRGRRELLISPGYKDRINNPLSIPSILPFLSKHHNEAHLRLPRPPSAGRRHPGPGSLGPGI